MASFQPFAVTDTKHQLLHWSLNDQCGACGTQVKPGEDVVAMLGAKGGGWAGERTDKRPFLELNQTKKHAEGYLCRWSACKSCAVSPTAVVLHVECLDAYLTSYRTAKSVSTGADGSTSIPETANAPATPPETSSDASDDALRSLWTLGTYRLIWDHAPMLSLYQTRSAHATVGDSDLLRRLGLPDLNLLPPELTDAIYNMSKDSRLWVLGPVAQLARMLAEYNPSASGALPGSLSLDEVKAWERGGELARDAGNAAAVTEYIRLTIDAYGLRKIERLPARPEYSGAMTTGRLAYIVCEVAAVKGVEVHFKFGLARLRLPPSCKGFQTWNTPAPPPMAACTFSRKRPLQFTESSYMQIVDLAEATGLTGFFCNGELLALHVHTKDEPTAQTTFDHLGLPETHTMWLYMPLVPKDRIEAVGLRREGYSKLLTQNELTIMFRKHISGDTLMGHSLYDSDVDTMLTRPDQQARALVLGIQGGGPIVDVGAYNETASPAVAAAGLASAVRDGTQRQRFMYSSFQDEQLLESPSYQGTVPLDGLVRAEVFVDGENGQAHGMLLAYQDSCQRAVGMVCVGTDKYHSRVYDRPVRLCFTGNESMQGSWVHFLCEADLGEADLGVADHKHTEGEEEEWESHELTGRIEWAVDSYQMKFEYFDTPISQPDEVDEEDEHPDEY